MTHCTPTVLSWPTEGRIEMQATVLLIHSCVLVQSFTYGHLVIEAMYVAAAYGCRASLLVACRF
jgi:hypothetical protein